MVNCLFRGTFAMTLPIQQRLCGDKATSLSLSLRCNTAATSDHRRRPSCLSAGWADPPPPSQTTTRRERRREICSWSVGYGTLNELEELYLTGYEDQTFKRVKVADNTVLLEGRGRRLASSIAVPHESRPRNNRIDLLGGMPGIKSIFNRRRNSGSADTSSPLVGAKKTASLASLKKCDPMLALTGVLRSSSSSSSIEPLQATNRLRVSPTPTGSTSSYSRMCSRCSSLLTLASTSRYSLNSTAGFVQLPSETSPVLCKLCLAEVPFKNIVHIQQCRCSFCIECMKAYVEFEIAEGAYDISCPDAQCPSQGVLKQEEIKRLVGSELLEKHIKYRLNREVELDKSRTWCPRAGCETVCVLCPSGKRCLPQSVFCPTCSTDFCSNCKMEWHEGLTCDDYNKQLAKEGKTEELPIGPGGLLFDNDLIKCCPMCNVPIEKDEGCAQMMCKRCKHVFCWYCLASLDDDFLLRHYDKGPCKNKLGHSRASVIWHRTQVIGIFAGFGILLLVASPLLLLAAPCIVCCKCRVCNIGNTKLDNEDDPPPNEES